MGPDAAGGAAAGRKLPTQRWHMRRRLIATSLLFLTLALGVSPALQRPTGPDSRLAAPAAEAAALGQGTNVLRFGQAAADVGTLDPHFASGTQDRSLVDMVFNGLIRYVPGDGSNFEPDLATSLPEPRNVGGKQ